MHRFRRNSWQVILLTFVAFISLVASTGFASAGQISQPELPIADIPENLLDAPGFTIQGQGDGCSPVENFPSSGKVEGWGGLVVEYSIDGLAISDANDEKTNLAGYPTGSQVTVNLKFSGPYSIEGSWETNATVYLNEKVVERSRAPDQNGEAGWSYTAKPVVVTITDEIRKNGFYVLGDVGYARSSNAEGISVKVQMLGCDQPLQQEQPTEAVQSNFPASEPDGNNGGSGPSIAAILLGLGALVVVGGVIAAGVIRILNKGTPKPASPSNQGPTPKDDLLGYELRVSPGQVKTGQGQAASISVAVFATYRLSGVQPVPQARISLSLSPNVDGLQVLPVGGQGQLVSVLSQTGPVDISEAAVIVKAAAPGWQTEKKVHVEIMQSYHLEFF